MERRDEFTSCPQSVSAARRLVRTTLDEAGHSHLVERVTLALSELATNAVLYGECESFGVELTVARSWVAVAVVDGSAALPVPPHKVPVDAVRGRGLSMVAALADAWGVEPCDGGKRIWARFGEVA